MSSRSSRRRLLVGCVLVLAALSGCAAEPSTGPGAGSVTESDAGAADAHDVTATMTVYSGGEKLRTMTHRVGTLRAGEEVTVTRRISLSFAEANRVRQHGARILLVIDSAERTETFEERYTV